MAWTWAGVWARRLARHALLERAPPAQLVAVAGAVCGIHAQVMPAAELSLGVRVAGVTRQDVRAALWEERRLVKTYGIRGTVHLFPVDELPLWMAALRTRAAVDAPRFAELGLDVGRLAVVVAAIGDALDGQRLTLPQLGAAVGARVGAWALEGTGAAWGGQWPRWRMALGAAAGAGSLCFGPPQGSAVTFVRPDQWAGPWRDLDPDAALAEVLCRYLHAYGPATSRDFAQWFAIPPRQAADLAARLGDELVEVDVEGTPGLLPAADAVRPAAPAGDSVRLLPHFDCYVVGCHPRQQLLPAAWAARVPPRTIPSQVPVLLVDGRVAGVWARQAAGRRVAIRVEPFVPLTPGQLRLLEAEAAHVGAVLGADAALKIGPVALRPHL